MRPWWWFAFLAACAPAPAPHVAIAAPSARLVAPAPPAALDPMPDDAAPLRSSASGDWARAFPAAPTFRTIDARAARVLFTWRIGAGRTVKVLAPDEDDYPGNHVSETSLVVRAAGADNVIPLGELAGTPGPNAVTYCKNRGYRIDSDGGWAFPKEPSVASAFEMSIMQGSDDFLLVRDGGTVHVLQRATSDGRCDEAKQGPLDICDGASWSRIAEIRVGGADLFERIDEGGAFDCAAEHWGERLVFP